MLAPLCVLNVISLAGIGQSVFPFEGSVQDDHFIPLMVESTSRLPPAGLRDDGEAPAATTTASVRRYQDSCNPMLATLIHALLRCPLAERLSLQDASVCLHVILVALQCDIHDEEWQVSAARSNVIGLLVTYWQPGYFYRNTNRFHKRLSPWMLPRVMRFAFLLRQRRG